MASSPITSWPVDGETMETMTGFIFLGSKVNADGDCGHEIKRCLLLGRKAMPHLDSILKSRYITLLTKVHLVKAIFFPSSQVWIWELDSKESWAWRILLRVLWSARRPNQSIPNEISPEYALEGLMLKLQYFGHLMQRTDSLEKDPDAGKDWRQEETGMRGDEIVGWHHRLDGHEFEQAPRLGERQGSLACCSPWGHKESDMTEWLNWTELNT